MLVERERLSSRITIDSAGTHGYQLGEQPDSRAMHAARQRGYELSSQRARLFELDDFRRFDWIVAMDSQNLRFLKSLRPAGSSRSSRALPRLCAGTRAARHSGSLLRQAGRLRARARSGRARRGATARRHPGRAGPAKRALAAQARSKKKRARGPLRNDNQLATGGASCARWRRFLVRGLDQLQRTVSDLDSWRTHPARTRSLRFLWHRRLIAL